MIAYDSDLRPTSIVAPNVESLAFTYDAANRIIRDHQWTQQRP